MSKLFILPVPVAFGPEFVEGSILLRGVGVVKVAKAGECLDGEAQGKRGRSTVLSRFTCRYSMGW